MMSRSKDVLLRLMPQETQFCAYFPMRLLKHLELALTVDGLSPTVFGVAFIAAKSRVAPLKKLTIPRLELQAAVLATRLGKTIREESRFVFEKVVYFVDSTIVLGWIRSQASSFKTFVSTRIGEIQSNSDPAEWKHIHGKENVADDVSRGIPVQGLQQRWKSGPDFLRHPEEEWPQTTSITDENTVNLERLQVSAPLTRKKKL